MGNVVYHRVRKTEKYLVSRYDRKYDRPIPEVIGKPVFESHVKYRDDSENPKYGTARSDRRFAAKKVRRASGQDSRSDKSEKAPNRPEQPMDDERKRVEKNQIPENVVDRTVQENGRNDPDGIIPVAPIGEPEGEIRRIRLRKPEKPLGYLVSENAGARYRDDKEESVGKRRS